MSDRKWVATQPTDPYATLALTYTHTMKKTAKQIATLAMPPAEGKTNYKVIEGDNFLQITPEVFRMCKDREVSEVEFVENGTLTTKDGTVLKNWKVVDFTESELILLTEKTKLELARVDDKYKVLERELTFKKKLKDLGEI